MHSNHRQHLRFSLDIPVLIFPVSGPTIDGTLQQISIGGCFTPWINDIFLGDIFRIELFLPTGNKLPLYCKAIYKFEGSGIGAKFVDITRFEQELIAQTIKQRLYDDGMHISVDPFSTPTSFFTANDPNALTDARQEKEKKLQHAMSDEDMA